MDKTSVAVKTGNLSKELNLNLYKKLKILKQFYHPTIVKLIEVQTQIQTIYIIKKLVPGSNFLCFLVKKDELKTMKFSLDAASG